MSFMQPASQPAGQPACRPASQAASQRGNQPASQPATKPSQQPAKPVKVAAGQPKMLTKRWTPIGIKRGPESEPCVGLEKSVFCETVIKYGLSDSSVTRRKKFEIRPPLREEKNLVGWLAACLAGRLAGLLMFWLGGWLGDWADCLAGWLVG